MDFNVKTWCRFSKMNNENDVKVKITHEGSASVHHKLNFVHLGKTVSDFKLKKKLYLSSYCDLVIGQTGVHYFFN